MKHETLDISIDTQLKRITSPQPEVNLHAPCKLGEGIIALTEFEALTQRSVFQNSQLSSAFFIPASGSGSRMFEFLFEFIQEPTEETRGQVERFLNHVEDFAFFHQFPLTIQQQLRERTMDIDAFVRYILNDNGMGLAHLPKGLIPFHKQGHFLLNPFHEHILQGLELTGNNCSFHFTIRSAFESYIKKRLTHLEGMTGKQLNITFSVQNPDTDAIAFDENNQVALCENNTKLKRPAGHGALLENLNTIEADIIFIKNIDNVQHQIHARDSIETQQFIGGLMITVQAEINAILLHPTHEKIEGLNTKYQLFHPSELKKEISYLIEVLKRPLRVCGMVRNEGQPGGGPFWIDDNGTISKQIIEKAQINMRGDQYRLSIQSTHFNPVIMACSGKLWNGAKLNFRDFRDVESYFIVTKKYRGKQIKFTELPGLWNGSMAHWNSIFVEIPSSTFSPVKTILDLLEPAHQG